MLFIFGILYGIMLEGMRALPIPTEPHKLIAFKITHETYFVGRVIDVIDVLGSMVGIPLHIHQRKKKVDAYRTQLHELQNKEHYNSFNEYALLQVTTTLELINNNPRHFAPA